MDFHILVMEKSWKINVGEERGTLLNGISAHERLFHAMNNINKI